MNPESRDVDGLDPRLAAAYREAATEMPPASLDDAIRAAARREAGSAPRRVGAPYVGRWAFPVSMAAVVILSVTIVTLVQEEAGDFLEEPPRSAPAAPRIAAAPPPAPAESRAAPESRSAPAAAPQAFADRKQAADAYRENAESEAASRQRAAVREESASSRLAERRLAEAALARDDRAPAPPSGGQGAAGTGLPPAGERVATGPAEPRAAAVPESRPPGSMVARESSTEDAARRQAPVRMAAPAPAAAKVTEREQPGSVPAMVRELDRQPPERWLARVADLRREGRTTEADALFAEFQKRYPDHSVPAPR